MRNIFKTLLFIICFPVLSFASAEDFLTLQQECKNNQKFVDLDYQIECGKHFHHYNTNGRVKRNSKDSLRISHFNALHPGNGKTRFKDYKLVARMLSLFDIIAVTELIPAMANEMRINNSVQAFAKAVPKGIKKSESELRKLQKLQKKKFSIVREREIALTKLIIKSYKSDLKRLKEVYRLPGYLKILKELREISADDNWSLILSSIPEGSASNPTKELTGFFYKASLVEPIDNPYCSRRNLSNGRDSYACHPLFDRSDLGSNKRDVFSRRPFMGSFKAGNFETTLIATHSLFDSPGDEETKENILKKAFGERSLDNFSTGINNSNYARFAELNVILELIEEEIEPNDQNDIILLGDFNLESSNQFMQKTLRTWSQAEIFIDQATSTTDKRYDINGEETYGLASNYDHFIFNPYETSECMSSSNEINGGVFNFLNLKSRDFIADKYEVRTNRKDRDGFYTMNRTKYNRVQSLIIKPLQNEEENFLKIGKKTFTFENKHTQTALGIIRDEDEAENHNEKFYERVIRTQLSESTYYNYYKQVISDHLPIYMSCDI